MASLRTDNSILARLNRALWTTVNAVQLFVHTLINPDAADQYTNATWRINNNNTSSTTSTSTATRVPGSSNIRSLR